MVMITRICRYERLEKGEIKGGVRFVNQLFMRVRLIPNAQVRFGYVLNPHNSYGTVYHHSDRRTSIRVDVYFFDTRNVSRTIPRCAKPSK